MLISFVMVHNKKDSHINIIMEEPEKFSTLIPIPSVLSSIKKLDIEKSKKESMLELNISEDLKEEMLGSEELKKTMF